VTVCLSVGLFLQDLQLSACRVRLECLSALLEISKQLGERPCGIPGKLLRRALASRRVRSLVCIGRAWLDGAERYRGPLLGLTVDGAADDEQKSEPAPVASTFRPKVSGCSF
jgi:hypothetical protein